LTPSFLIAIGKHKQRELYHKSAGKIPTLLETSGQCFGSQDNDHSWIALRYSEAWATTNHPAVYHANPFRDGLLQLEVPATRLSGRQHPKESGIMRSIYQWRRSRQIEIKNSIDRRQNDLGFREIDKRTSPVSGKARAGTPERPAFPSCSFTIDLTARDFAGRRPDAIFDTLFTTRLRKHGCNAIGDSWWDRIGRFAQISTPGIHAISCSSCNIGIRSTGGNTPADFDRHITRRLGGWYARRPC
jgi:hypothetical protein